MASNGVLSPPPATDPIPDNVTLRIVILAHGNRNEDDLYLVLNLDTTIGSLKERIQQSLARQPAPETQRLIYHGRPLQDNSSTLRQILRIEQTSSNVPATAHVLHLVIRDGQSGNVRPPTSNTEPQPQHSTRGSVGHGVQAAGTHQAQGPQIPQMPQLPLNFLPQPFAAPLQTAQMMLHNQLHMMQHQMQHQMAVNNAQQAANRMASSHSSDRGQNQVDRSTNQLPNIRENLNPASTTGIEQMQPQVQNSSTHDARANSGVQIPTGTSTQPSEPSVRVHETIGPNGERIRTVINNGSMTFRIGGPGMPNPFERPASAPGLSPTAEEAPVITGAPLQPPNPGHTAHPPPIPSVQRQPQVPFPPMFSFGRQIPQPTPFMNIPGNPLQVLPTPQTSQNHPSETVAWLLNSPNGPQGIVSAPGHGFFSSQRSESAVPNLSHNTQPTSITTTTANSATATRPATGLPPGQTQLARLQERIQQRAQPQVGNQGPGQRQNVEEHDVLNLIIQRGWLFLRLYMFIFVLSESGTWRRFIMLSLAVLVCVLPRRNPFTNGFTAMRRHVDNLIGPPDLARRQEQERQRAQPRQNETPNENNQESQRQATEQAGAVNRAAQSSSATSSMPSSEENARRLLREHQERNPNFMRDMFYRVEQAVALFLASLVPGVGERHVRAREEARRIIEEEERRRQEEQQRTEEQQSNASNAEAKQESPSESTITQDTNHGGASPSGVDTSNSGSSEGIRLRAGDSS